MLRNCLLKYVPAPVLMVGLVVLAAALGTRYGLLENGVLPHECGATYGESIWSACGFKWALVQSFLQQRMGWASLALGVLAFVFSCRRAAWAGWLIGMAGLVLYSYDYAAVGALLSLLVLARGAEQDRQREDEAGDQPADRLQVGRLG
ncbi:hypothetical protein [Azoarcus indigens]|uniref:Uncharacterized protein n=1 Tax=Azoarcus indigens TaxID=29545 RepID=A0A4R6EGF6_9RHOO|nr:hypothetical protein [Azoarcus indigens]TDN56648.1 hypothetical protein C7389_10127 [Azoarcus indigens]